MFGLFGKKCEYCGVKIDKGEEFVKNVKDPRFVGTRPKNFCSSEHANNYEKEVKNRKKSGGGGSCCG